ncbi:hypothetical protein KI688_012492 [Linnemannia hyalina]|uniref:Uncharacterized protein n=1 Tax=Linnemannia hyalina TaxID=64524 RepID=A0A9P7XVB6_9FUNG|nr:hypothetical protein KI688_012492 [Linnemannia hyalina]
MRNLHHCLLVSHHWHAQAEPWLYGNNVVINPAFQRTHASLIQTLRTRKHLLRKVEWQSHFHGGEVLVPEDLLDVFLDYRPPPVDDNKRDNDLGAELGATTASQQRQRLRMMVATSSAVLGPNRPSLTHFSFVGVDHFGCLLNTILFNLTTTNLTTLELHLVGYGTANMYSADMARILDTFVYLKNLSITGNMARYLSPPEVKGDSWQHDETDSPPFSETTATMATTTTNPSAQSHQQYRLETFAFDPRMLTKDGPDVHAIFKRLRNLKRIQIRSSVNYFDCFSYCSPWVFGQILSQCCPELEAIETWGPVALWFFDLPILPSDKIPHLTVLTQESSPLPEEWSEFVTVSDVRESLLERRFRGQEVDELLVEGKGLASYFPRLKTLILGQDHSLGAQDFILLGLQARFLTHVEIYHRPVHLKFVWDMYDKDAALVADELADPTITMASTYNAILENRRLRKRWKVGTREVLLFLQHCSSLRYFSLTGYAIESKDLIQSSRGDETGETPAAEGLSFIEPWACEESLETLTIGFDMSYNPSKDHHALVWKHLGRFKKLRSLTLPLSTLIPSPAYGVEGLLTGGDQHNETLEEIRSLPSWWKIDDRKEMVLWYAKSCPRLKVLGLEYTKLRDVGGWSFSSFVGDEDVRRCSIRRVFVETAFS